MSHSDSGGADAERAGAGLFPHVQPGSALLDYLEGCGDGARIVSDCLDAVMTKHGNKWQLGDDAEQHWLSSLQILELTRDSIEEDQPASDCLINLDRMSVTIRPVDAMAVKREVEEPEWRRKSSRWA